MNTGRSKKRIACLMIVIMVMLGSYSVSANDYYTGCYMWDVNYNVIVSAPDGGVNFRYGPGVEYDRLIDHMISNGEVLHVMSEATASNGNNWGLTTYNGMTGWIALTQVSYTDLPVPDSQNNNAGRGIVFERHTETMAMLESATITRYDDNGNVVWEKYTDSYGMAQLERVGEIGEANGMYYYVEDGVIKALDVNTGFEVWRNAEYQGAASKAHVFDAEGNLYICGYLGPDLCIIAPSGKTLYRRDQMSKEYYWPYEVWLEGDSGIYIRFEGGNAGSDPNGFVLKYDLNQLGYR